MRQMRVLVIDRDRHYRQLIRTSLALRGYRVLLAPNGRTGLALLARREVDLTILDTALPEIEGHELCLRLRDAARVPFIIVSALADEPDRVRGLQLGADDYLAKPFATEELVARVEAVLRRRQPGGQIITPPALADGDLKIDFTARRVWLRGSPIPLGQQEYGVLYQLALKAGRLIERDLLLERVWGAARKGRTELLYAAIGRLRRKIERDPSRPRRVLTRHGLGYVLQAPIVCPSGPAGS
jgi:DNA-binding response OmpR family regulator